jgi:hypothetical protein
LVVLSGGVDDPSGRITDLVGKVHEESPTTTILVLGAVPADQPAEAESAPAELYLAFTASLMEVYSGILAAGRASRVTG